MSRPRAAGAAALAVALALPSPAAANGRYPASNLVVVDPNDPEHLIVRGTFGLLETRDGGRTLNFVCEGALQLGVEEDPMLTIGPSGVRAIATFGGMLSSEDGCNYRLAPELAREIVPDLAAVGAGSSEILAFRLRGQGAGRYESQLLRSEDEGRSWLRLEPLLPDTLMPLTIDVAASDRRRVYLSARLGAEGGYASVLLRSDDAGASFTLLPIPETSDQRLAFLAAVDGADADRLYVRVDDPAGNVLWTSGDGGASFERLFDAQGRLTAFALSRDGRRLAFGGTSDGLWLSQPRAGLFERRSDVGASCLAFAGELLYACADACADGFSFGHSRDEGRSFEPLFRIDELRGTSSCAPGSDVAALCPAEWRAVAPTLGAACPDVADPAAVLRPQGGCALAGATPASYWPLAIGGALGALARFRRLGRGRTCWRGATAIDRRRQPRRLLIRA